MSSRTRRSRISGLSIWRVLVGLAALVFAAAFLYPMLFAVHRTPGRHSTCLNNLKECAIALHTYCQDYNDCLPSSAVVNRSKMWNRQDFTRFATVSGARAVTGRPTTWVQALYGHMKSKDIMFCPLDSVQQDDPQCRTSFYWKLAVDKAWYGAGCSKPCRKLSDFAHTADQTVLYERAASTMIPREVSRTASGSTSHVWTLTLGL